MTCEMHLCHTKYIKDYLVYANVDFLNSYLLKRQLKEFQQITIHKTQLLIVRL